MNIHQKINLAAFSIILLSGVSLASVSYATPPAGQSYPYKAAGGNCGANSDAVALGTVDQCIPFNAIQNETGKACDAGSHLITVPSGLSGGKTFYCILDATTAKQGGVAKIDCPPNTNLTIDSSGNPTGCQVVTAADGCPNQADRIQIYTDGRILCKVQPTSLTGVTGNQIASPCDTGYKKGTNGSKSGECNAGDYSMDCGTKGFLCVTGLSTPDASKITQTVHPYITKYTLPCQSLAGGQCASDQTPAGYIARLYQFGLMIVGLFAFGGIVYGALKYVLSAGSMADESEARDIITQSILGLLLLLGSFLILYTINPDITNLKNPNLEVIQIDKIIKAGEVTTNPGTQNILTGGGTTDNSLCKLAVNGSITINGGNNTGSTCISCKSNASKDSSGTCQCNAPLTQYQGECLKMCAPGQTSGCVPNAVTACAAGTTFDPAQQKCVNPKQVTPVCPPLESYDYLLQKCIVKLP